MDRRRFLQASGAGAITMAAYPLALGEEEGSVPALTSETRAAAIKAFLPTTDNKKHELVNNNNEYLADKLQGREDLDLMLQDIAAHRKNLTVLLQKHGGRPIMRDKTNTVDELSNAQLLRISVLMHDLEHTDLPKQIGGILDASIKKKQESGGDVQTPKGVTLFRPLENASEGFDKRHFSGNYRFPEKYELTTPNLFLFHTHPKEASNSPSSYIQGSRYGVTMRGDVPSSANTALYFGESHQVVISAKEEGKFNIDYFGGNAEDAKKPRNQFDVEAMLAHVRTLDLGVYEY